MKLNRFAVPASVHLAAAGAPQTAQTPVTASVSGLATPQSKAHLLDVSIAQPVASAPSAGSAAPTDAISQALTYANASTVSWLSAFKAPVTGDTVYGGVDPSSGKYTYVGPGDAVYQGNASDFYHSNYQGGAYVSTNPANASFLNPTNLKDLVSTSVPLNAAQTANFNQQTPETNVLGQTSTSNTNTLLGSTFTELGSGTQEQVALPAVTNYIANGGAGASGASNTQIPVPPAVPPAPVITPPADTSGSTVPAPANAVTAAGTPAPATDTSTAPDDAATLAGLLTSLASGGAGGGGSGLTIPSPVVVPAATPAPSSAGPFEIGLVVSLIAGGVWYYIDHRKKHAAHAE